MKVSLKGISFIAQQEGCRLVAYKCPAGVWTIGYGYTSPAIRKGVRWTQEQADSKLAESTTHFADGVDRMVVRDLKQHEFDALVSFAYNIGLRAFNNSGLLKAVNAGFTAPIPYEFNKWVYAGGKKIPGLASRRAREIALYNNSIY